jgi:hypothetical protein
VREKTELFEDSILTAFRDGYEKQVSEMQLAIRERPESSDPENHKV